MGDLFSLIKDFVENINNMKEEIKIFKGEF